jgi:hypothetical protein
MRIPYNGGIRRDLLTAGGMLPPHQISVSGNPAGKRCAPASVQPASQGRYPLIFRTRSHRPRALCAIPTSGFVPINEFKIANGDYYGPRVHFCQHCNEYFSLIFQKGLPEAQKIPVHFRILFYNEFSAVIMINL